jgi:5-formyltetrahydrofolate cyclo-ligase
LNNDTLRKQLRARRAGLTSDEQRRATLAAYERIRRLQRFRRARRIAAYVGCKGELDPMPLLHLAFSLGKQCYLPVLHPFLNGRLWFAPWTPDMPMRANRFGIPEPPCHADRIIKPQWLDLVITPLLGFDSACHRLGMGGGFYDRTFAMTRSNMGASRPCLLGVAHDIQRCDSIPKRPWDIKLDAVVTPSRLYMCTAID